MDDLSFHWKTIFEFGILPTKTSETAKYKTTISSGCSVHPRVRPITQIYSRELERYGGAI